MKRIMTYDELKRVYELINPFVIPLSGLSHNVQAFRGQYVDMSKKVAELEKISSSVANVPESKLDVVKGELRLLQEKKVILERKLLDN